VTLESKSGKSPDGGASPEIFVHVGLHKTGTTFLQRNVFSRWPGISFYNANIPILPFLGSLGSRKILISNESLWCNTERWKCAAVDSWASYGNPRLVEESLAALRNLFPDARILMSFRRHSSFVLSLYLQYLHQGGTEEFQRFFDFTGNQGLLNKHHISFQHVVEVVESLFANPPFLFLQEELHDDLSGTLSQIGRFLGSPPPGTEQLRKQGWCSRATRKNNRSVGYYQAKILRRLNRLTRSVYNPRGILPLSLVSHLRMHPRRLCQRTLFAWLLPYRPVRLDEGVRQAIDNHFRADWQYIIRRKAEIDSMLA